MDTQSQSQIQSKKKKKKETNDFVSKLDVSFTQAGFSQPF